MGAGLHVVMVHHFCSIPRYGKSTRTYSIAHHLAKLGCEVTVISASFSHSRATQPAVTGAVTEEMIDGVRFLFLKTPAYRGGIPGRLLNMAVFSARYLFLARSLAARLKPDTVVEGTTYMLPFFASRRMAKRAGASLVLEVRDLWPLTLYEAGMSRRNPAPRLFAWMQRKAVARARMVVSSLARADLYLRENGAEPARFLYIPNGVDEDLYETRRPLAPAVAARFAEIGRSYRGIIGYAGSMGKANSVDILIGLGDALAERGIAIVVIGQGPMKESLQAAAPKNVFFFDPVPKAEIFEIIARLDLGFVGGRKKAVHRYGISPNKLYDYMISGTAVLNCLNCPNSIVEDAGCGYTVEDPTPDAILAAVDRFFALPEDDRRAMGQAGRDHVLSHNSYADLARRYLEAVRTL